MWLPALDNDVDSADVTVLAALSWVSDSELNDEGGSIKAPLLDLL